MQSLSVTRAYRTLGLTSRASPAEIRTRYKELVRKWHPDQYAQDPQNYAEAERELRRVIMAYKVLEDRGLVDEGPTIEAPEFESSPDARPPDSEPRARSRPIPQMRLSREEIERLIEHGKGDNAVDVLWMAFVAVAGIMLLNISDSRHTPFNPWTFGASMLCFAYVYFQWRKRRG